MKGPQRRFWEACRVGDLGKMRELVWRVDLNRHNSLTGTTALHTVILKGHREALKLLLELPHLDVNAMDTHGATALHMAVRLGESSLMRLLLADGRTNATLRSNHGTTALWQTSHEPKLETLELLMASGKPLDFYCRHHPNGHIWENTTVLEVMRQRQHGNNYAACIQLLEAYEQDPLETSRQLRRGHGALFLGQPDFSAQHFLDPPPHQ